MLFVKGSDFFFGNRYLVNEDLEVLKLGLFGNLSDYLEFLVVKLEEYFLVLNVFVGLDLNVGLVVLFIG